MANLNNLTDGWVSQLNKQLVKKDVVTFFTWAQLTFFTF